MLLGKSSSIQIINMIKFTNRLMVTLGFEEHRLAFWDSLTEINRNYLRKKFKIPKPVETDDDDDAVILPQENPWILFHALTGKPELYCLVQVAFQLKLIDSNKKSDLLNELFGTVDESKIKNNKRRSRVEKPIWYKGEGLLTFNDKLVLKTQVRGKVTIIQNILQAFQALNWPEKIDDPFAKTIKSDRRFILGYLNRLAKKSGISFSRSPDRKFIQWHSPIQRD
jgi:hypothetical protein